MYSEAAYPSSIVSARGENLIVGERVCSTETMNVVEVSGSMTLEKPMCGEIF